MGTLSSQHIVGLVEDAEGEEKPAQTGEGVCTHFEMPTQEFYHFINSIVNNYKLTRIRSSLTLTICKKIKLDDHSISSDEQLEDYKEGIQGDEWDPHVLLEGVDEEY